MIARPRFRWLQRGLLILGVLLLALWSRNELESRGFQSAASKRLEAAAGRAEAGPLEAAPNGVAFVGPPVPALPSQAVPMEGVLGRIEVPRLHISAIVAEGSDANTLRHAVGHVTWTAQPGSPGNCALAGHRDTFLRPLRNVRVNDVIHLVTLDRTYTYRVEWSAVLEPQRVDVLDSTATPSLTLVTCYPFLFVGHAPKRFVVRARQVEAVARASALGSGGQGLASTPVVRNK
jgi:sortase A